MLACLLLASSPKAARSSRIEEEKLIGWAGEQPRPSLDSEGNASSPTTNTGAPHKDAKPWCVLLRFVHAIQDNGLEYARVPWMGDKAL